MRFLILISIASLVSNFGFSQKQKEPILATRGVIKLMPFRLANPYHSLQFGLEHRLAKKVYLNHEAGWVFGTYRFMDAIQNTRDKARGLILKSEIRYYIRDFHLADGHRTYYYDDNILGEECENMYFGIQVENRNVSFNGTEYNGVPTSIKINSNRLSFNLVIGTHIYAAEDADFPITFDLGIALGYSIQHFGASELNGVMENDAIEYYINKKLIDGRNFFNFSPICKIGYAF